MIAVNFVCGMPISKTSKTSKKYRLDLCCGNNLQKGFIGLDIVGKPKTQATIVHDLNVYPWPFKDNSVDEVFCSHYIEHTPDLMKFMNELHRIMKRGATVSFIAPYYTSMRAWQDPTHTRVISEATFLYYDQEWLKANNLQHYPITANFKVTSMNPALSPEYNGRSSDAIQYAMLHYWNVVMDIQATLRKV